MGDDTPNPDRHWKDEGFEAERREPATLASYLSSVLYLLAVPGTVGAAYAGYWAGYYSYDMVIPVFGGLLVALIALAFVVMHVTTGGQ